MFLLRPIELEHLEILATQAGKIRFGEAHNLGALGGGVCLKPSDSAMTVVEAGGDARRCEGNAHR
jgi:hypothetical protein